MSTLSYSRADAAHLLGVQPQTLDQLVTSGKLNVYRVLGMERYSGDEIRALAPEPDLPEVCEHIDITNALGTIHLPQYPRVRGEERQSIPTASGIQLLKLIDEALSGAPDSNSPHIAALLKFAAQASVDDISGPLNTAELDVYGLISRLRIADWRKLQEKIPDYLESIKTLEHCRELVLAGLSRVDMLTDADCRVLYESIGLIESALLVSALLSDLQSETPALSGQDRLKTWTSIIGKRKRAQVLVQNVLEKAVGR